MITTIDNNSRVFQVTYGNCNQIFCNIHDLNMLVKANELRKGYFKIFYFENNKPKKCSKLMLRNFFDGVQLSQTFFY